MLHVTKGGVQVSQQDVNGRVRKHREALRRAGLRPVQIWVPDTRRPDFAEECGRQSQLVRRADDDDIGIQEFLTDALTDLPGWTP